LAAAFVGGSLRRREAAMLAMLVAVTMAATPMDQPVAHAAAPAPPRVTRFILADQPRPFLRNSGVCKAAGRMQTAYEPALLYREQDRDAGRLRKLIELPEASACLLGGAGPSAVIPDAGK
jgi:hypothetical protein